MGWYYWWFWECVNFGLNGRFSCGSRFPMQYVKLRILATAWRSLASASALSLCEVGTKLGPFTGSFSCVYMSTLPEIFTTCKHLPTDNYSVRCL